MGRTVYLGKRVRDVRKKGLDSVSEFYGIMREIMKDYRSGRIDAKKARGRLLLLYLLTFRRKNKNVMAIPKKQRIKIRNDIKKLLRKL
ncbi:MAG: hypothetical protein QXP34_01825 [Candidatus Aenigmatarchaeota archaeon]